MATYPTAPAVELASGPVDPRVVFAELKHVIGEAITNHPRSQQVEIGPSEIGTPCDRRIGYKLLNKPEVNIQPPPWRPTVGTAVHAWLEDTFEAHNVESGFIELGSGRWLTERRLVVGQLHGQALVGTCDLFDQVTGTSIDWKVVGPTTLRKVKAGKVDRAYRVQGHTYGRGWKQLGFQVHTVMTVFLPSAGELADAQLWWEPFDESQAVESIARAERIWTLVDLVGEAALSGLPIAEAYCSHCPWFRVGSTDVATGCPGVPELNVRHPVNSSTVDLLVPALRGLPAVPS